MSHTNYREQEDQAVPAGYQYSIYSTAMVSGLNAVLKHKPLWIKSTQRSPELGQFGFTPVQFEAEEFGDTQGLFQQFPNVVEMGQGGIAIDIGFAAEHDIVIDGEVVVETARFR